MILAAQHLDFGLPGIASCSNSLLHCLAEPRPDQSVHITVYGPDIDEVDMDYPIAQTPGQQLCLLAGKLYSWRTQTATDQWVLPFESELAPVAELCSYTGSPLQVGLPLNMPLFRRA
jgi:hypothetical protein